ncbi:MAG: hypothetical protein IH596_13245 [Bacteroidales bacterium]|nr:hypothetical protein [Bacteroidales bacterium]
MKTNQKSQKKFGLLSWILVFYSVYLPDLIFIWAPGRTYGATGISPIITNVAISILDGGDSINLFDMKFKQHLAPLVPLEADFEDFTPKLPNEITALEPQIPAEADFDDTCDVIRNINTSGKSICCVTGDRLNKSCL